MASRGPVRIGGEAESEGSDSEAPQGWRALALAARKAARALEPALAAQEEALEKAGLLGEERPGEPESLAAARQVATARSLRWRLQLARQRRESTALELSLRKQYIAELEGIMEEFSARLAEMRTEGRAPPAAAATAAAAPAPEQPPRVEAPKAKERPEPARKTGPEAKARPPSRRGGPRGIPRRAAGIGDVGGTEAEAPVLAAGTGDTEDGALPRASPRSEETAEEMEALEKRERQLRAESADLKEQISRLASELGAKRVKAAALRQEDSVKDALLRLATRAEKPAGKEELLEGLLERALSPLAAILMREQSANAVAAATCR